MVRDKHMKDIGAEDEMRKFIVGENTLGDRPMVQQVRGLWKTLLNRD